MTKQTRMNESNFWGMVVSAMVILSSKKVEGLPCPIRDTAIMIKYDMLCTRCPLHQSESVYNSAVLLGLADSLSR